MASWRLLLPVLCIFSFPATALAQACLGIPLDAYGVAIAGGAAFGDGGNAYSASLHANVAPVTISGGYTLETLDSFESNANTFGGSIAVEMLPNVRVSACSFAGVSYGWVTDEVTDGFAVYDLTVSALTVPFGFAVGADLAAGPVLSFVPYIAPQFMYVRGTGTIEDAAESASSTESTTEFGGSLGLILSGPVFFGGPSVSLSTVGESEPTFSVTLGIVAH